MRGPSGIPEEGDEGPVWVAGYHILLKLFSSKPFASLYPSGTREALHRKGEEYKLFGPDQPKFVRMAAKYRDTMVPFGSIKEDDITELVLQYENMMKISLNQFHESKVQSKKKHMKMHCNQKINFLDPD